MVNHTIQPENVKRFVNLNHPDGLKECLSGYLFLRTLHTETQLGLEDTNQTVRDFTRRICSKLGISL